MEEMAKNDDLARDKMVQEALIEAAKILGQYGQSVDIAQIQSQQAQPREF